MRKLLFSLFLVPTFLFAQEITFSDDFVIKQDIAYYLIDNMEDSFVLFRDIPRERKIHILDDNMMHAGEVVIEFEHKNPAILDVVKARENQFSVIYTAKKKGVKYLRIENFDKAGNLQDTLTIHATGNLISSPQYQIEKSEDESMAFIYDIKYDRSISATMVDIKNLKVLWTKEFVNLGIKQLFQIKQYIVGNDGSFCLALLKDNIGLRRDEARFELFSYNKKSEKLDLLSVSLEGKLSASSIFKYDNLNNSLVGAGLYSDKNTIKSQGLYYLNIPTLDPDAYTLTFTPFEESFLSEYLQKKNIGNNRGVTSTKIKNIILRKDGGALVVGEKVETKGRQGSNLPVDFDPLDNSRADYYFDQIFIASLHPTGKKHWANIFQKKQYSFDDGGIYSSFFMFVGKKGLHMLFNDEVRNQSTISDFTIRGDGGYKRRAILNTVGVDIKLRVRDALQINSKEIVIPSQYRNKLKMVKFSF